jgi:hypothetical protein
MAVWEGEVIGVGCTLVFLHSCVSSLSSSSWIHVYTGVHMRAHTCIVHRHVHACTYTHTHTHTECPSCDLPREWPSLRLGVSVLGLSLLGALSHREPLGCRARPPAGSQGHMGLGFEL